MFESLKQEDPRNAVRCFASLLLSLVVHAAIVSVIVVLPLVFFNMLHADELVTFLIRPPDKLPDAPVPPVPPVRTAATGTAVITERFAPVPYKIPTGIPAPDESNAPPVLGSLVDGVGLPGNEGSSGTGLSELLDYSRVIDVPKPKPPVPHIPLRVGGDVQESKLMLKVVPVYPEIAIQAHAAGTVILEAEIDEEGNVASVKIVSGHPLLVNAAAQAVKQWKYSPTLLNGEPQAVLATVTVVFRFK
jgi:periplasmic protein TonB